MKIAQLFKSDIGTLALDEEGNIYRVLTSTKKQVIENGESAWKDELKFVRLKRIFEDFVKD